MDNFYKLVEHVNDLADIFINDNMTLVEAKELSLDERCDRLYINRDCIAIHRNMTGKVNYYGGFEYVNKECVDNIGDYVFYNCEDSRIEDTINDYYNKKDDNNSLWSGV